MNNTTATTAPKRTLWQLSEDMEALDAMLAEIGGDISDPEVEAYINQLFDEVEGGFNQKVDSYAALIKHKEAVATARKAEAEGLALSAKIEANQAEALKDRLKLIMEMRGIKKAGHIRTASVCGNGGKLPVVVEDESKVPDKYQTVTVQMTAEQWAKLAQTEQLVYVGMAPDTDAIREALEAGDQVPGCKLGDRGTHLRVK